MDSSFQDIVYMGATIAGAGGILGCAYYLRGLSKEVKSFGNKPHEANYLKEIYEELHSLRNKYDTLNETPEEKRNETGRVNNELASGFRKP